VQLTAEGTLREQGLALPNQIIEALQPRLRGGGRPGNGSFSLSY